MEGSTSAAVDDYTAVHELSAVSVFLLSHPSAVAGVCTGGAIWWFIVGGVAVTTVPLAAPTGSMVDPTNAAALATIATEDVYISEAKPTITDAQVVLLLLWVFGLCQ
jgi:hypothetical protein